MAHYVGVPTPAGGDCHDCCESISGCCDGYTLADELFATFSANADGSPTGFPLGTPLTIANPTAVGGDAWGWDGAGRPHCQRFVGFGPPCGDYSATGENFPLDAETCAAATKIGQFLHVICTDDVGGNLRIKMLWTDCTTAAGSEPIQTGDSSLHFATLTILSCNPFHARYENTVAMGLGPPYGVVDITE